MTKFAANTSVSVEKSRAEIESTVRRYKADGFVSGWEGNRAMIQFRCEGRYVKFIMTLPDPTDKRFTRSMRGVRSENVAHAAWEQACRQKWRALALMIKAKLEAVESKIVSFEQEFLPHIMMPDKRTVYEHTRDAVAMAYERGEAIRLLPDYSEPTP
jgi:hypothetical protein